MDYGIISRSTKNYTIYRYIHSCQKKILIFSKYCVKVIIYKTWSNKSNELVIGFDPLWRTIRLGIAVNNIKSLHKCLDCERAFVWIRYPLWWRKTRLPKSLRSEFKADGLDLTATRQQNCTTTVQVILLLCSIFFLGLYFVCILIR